MTVNANLGVGIHGDTVLTDFWYVQFAGPGDPMVVAVATLVLYTALPAFMYIYLNNNSAFFNVQQRLNYHGFLKLATRTTFSGAFGFSIVTKLYELILIMAMVHTWPSNVILPQQIRFGLGPFNDNTLLSFAMFALISSIGWGIFAVFVFSIGLFIKKNSIFLILGALIATGLIVGPGLLVMVLPKSLLFASFINVLFIPSLIAPGQMVLAVFNGKTPNVYLTFLIATAIYSSAAWLLTGLWIKHRTTRGVT